MDVLENPTFRNTFEGKAVRGHLEIFHLKAKPFVVVDILEWPAFWSTGNILFEVLEGMAFVDNLEKPICETLIFTKNVYSHRQPNKLVKTIKNHCPRLRCGAPKRVQRLQNDP